MRAEGWAAPWRWGIGALGALAMVMATGCGDSGSRGSSSVTGPTTAAESATTGSVTADKKKGKGGGGENENEANDDKGQNKGQARGRPEGEVQGTVAGRTAGCPTFTFQVAGVGISANGVTEFEGTSCATLQNGDLVKVEGQP